MMNAMYVMVYLGLFALALFLIVLMDWFDQYKM